MFGLSGFFGFLRLEVRNHFRHSGWLLFENRRETVFNKPPDLPRRHLPELKARRRFSTDDKPMQRSDYAFAFVFGRLFGVFFSEKLDSARPIGGETIVSKAMIAV